MFSETVIGRAFSRTLGALFLFICTSTASSAQSLSYMEYVQCLGWFNQYIRAADRFGDRITNAAPGMIDEVRVRIGEVALYVLRETDLLSHSANPSGDLVTDVGRFSQHRATLFESLLEQERGDREIINLTQETAACLRMFDFVRR